MKWISNDFWIIINDILINRGIIVRHSEHTRSTESSGSDFFKNKFAGGIFFGK